MLTEAHDRAQVAITKGNLEPSNEQIAFFVVNHICDSKVTVPASQINVPTVDKDGVEAVVLYYTKPNPDGSNTKWVCVNPQRMSDLYNACDDKVNSKAKFN